jgi:hypothetical protein
MIEAKVNLHGILYRVQLADEWTAVFSEDQGIGCRPTRFVMHRSAASLWQLSFGDGWGDDLPACHLAAAYEWCKARLGGDHDIVRLPVAEVVPHQWDFDESRRMTFCKACRLDMADSIRFRSCSAAAQEVMR